MSDIYRKGFSPQTRSITSSRNRLFAVPAGEDSVSKALGVVSSFAPTDARNTEAVRGIGFGDQIAELVPGMSDPIGITLSRTALYQQNVFQALGYKGGIDGLVRALKHHRWPFDLRQEIVISEVNTLNGTGLDALTAGAGPESVPGSGQVIATLYAGCWITNYSSTFSADTAIVAEEVTLSVTDIFAWSNSAPAPVTDLNSGGKKSSSIFVADGTQP